jgi:branched-chain amino acid transport system ATP-binding protein
MTDGLAVTGLMKRFSGITALEDIDLRIAPGERVGLIGPNGAGKTTLFNCVLGILPINAGRVTLDGTDLTGLPVHARARLGIGRTFQRMELFPETTVREHLLIADRVRHRTGNLFKDLIGRAPEPMPCSTSSAFETSPTSPSNDSPSAKDASSKWADP